MPIGSGTRLFSIPIRRTRNARSVMNAVSTLPRYVEAGFSTARLRTFVFPDVGHFLRITLLDGNFAASGVARSIVEKGAT